ncbi:hypothetical protein [Legionella impletisoli]|nr:hypothetical protein [Legionella impletisoli]
MAYLKNIFEKCDDANVVLLYAAKGKNHTHALVLKDVLESWPNWPNYT